MTQAFALFELDEPFPGDSPVDVRGGGAASALHPRKHPHETRVVADQDDRFAWLRARAQGVTATDAAKLSSIDAVKSTAYEKLHGTRGRGFGGSRYTDHGRTREPVIAEWVDRTHGIASSTLLYHAEGDRRHLATPDGLRVTDAGHVELCEIKTTAHAWRGIPRTYLRQVWWQQYVLGAERTLVVWEQHDEFRPVGAEPRCRWVDRDEDQIALLVRFANLLLDEIRPTRDPRDAAFSAPDRSFYRPGPLA